MPANREDTHPRRTFYDEATGEETGPAGRWASPLFFSGGIAGIPACPADTLPGLDAEVAAAFGALRRLLGRAGLGVSAIAQCFIWLSDMAHLPIIERHWRDLFPDPHDQAVRLVIPARFADRRRVELEVIAVGGYERQTILEVPGIGRRPRDAGNSLAAIMGNMLFAAAIDATRPDGSLSPDAGEQADQAFDNLARLARHCGFSPDDLAHMFVWQRDHGLRQRVNDPWAALFPDKRRRPARHALQVDLGEKAVQLGVIGVRDGRAMTLLELNGVSHTAQREPGFLPMSASRGDVLFSAAAFGAVPGTGAFIEDTAEQVRCAFANSLGILEAHAFEPGDVAHAYVWHKGDEYKTYLDPLWQTAFSDVATRPVRHDIESPLPSVLKVQIELIAVRGRR